MNSEIYTMLFIFFARILDVSIGTVRIILIARGYKYLAPILGFIEILIWLSAINKVFHNLNDIYSYLIYAGGFATGNYIGMLIEEKLAIGYQSLRIITSEKMSALSMTLCEEGFSFTSIKGFGMKGEANIIFTVVHKRDVESILKVVRTIEPEAFITIEDVRSCYNGFIFKRSFFEIFGRQIMKKK
ncbi:MAG: DUF2179 domain-containing protein [Spirochaetota bacterium]|nr:DUF2179 domain-containing protein [Spirochaetota bacterium]